MKKRIIPEGYEEIATGTICVGDRVWNKIYEDYQDATQECNLSVGACISVVRPKVSEQSKITDLLKQLCALIPQIKIVVAGVTELHVVGQCSQVIAKLIFHKGGKLKQVS